MFAGKAIACAAGAALVACLGTVGVAGASGVAGAGRCADGGVAAACAYVDANHDGVCDNCGAWCGGSAACTGGADATCDGTGARGNCDATCDGTGAESRADGTTVCGTCGNATCDGTHERLHLRTQDGACDGARANGRCHGGR